MSRINFAIIPLIFILILAVFSYMSPKFFTQKAANHTEMLNEMIAKRFTTLGNSIAHATFVVDAIVINDNAPLGEIISKVRQDEPEVSAIHFTDAKNVVIASSDPNLVGKNYVSDLLKSGTSVVRNKAGVYDGGFSISIGSKAIGALYFQAKPVIPDIKVTSASSPIPLVVGVVLAVISFLIVMGMGKNLETRMVE